MSDTPSGDAWQRRFEREREARKEAEALLHTKSRELFEANQSLAEQASDLATSLDQLRATQDALVQREKMAALGALVAGIAHEINTPLGVAMTAVTLGLERLGSLQTQADAGLLTRGQVRALIGELAEAMGLVRDNLERGAGLVRSFKMVAVDQASEEVRVVTIQELLRDIVASLRPMLRKSAVTTTVAGALSTPVAVAAGPLVQIVTNLIQNACVHAFVDHDGPRGVSVQVSDTGNTMRLVVTDNGAGMAPEVVARVFEPFFTTRRSQGGSGLGMNIAHNIVVSRFAGTIAVESAPRRGTAWDIRLPFGTPALYRQVVP